MSRAADIRRCLRDEGVGTVLRGALRSRSRRCWSLHEFRMYSLSASEVRPTGEGRGLRRDAIDDLLLYRPFAARDRRREDFLEVARRRLAQGQHVYTFTADGALLHYSWLEEGTERAGSEFDHEFRLPGPAAILWDDYTRPDARGRGLQTRSIHRRLQDAAAGGQTRMFIGVRADNAISRHNIEKVGFTHWASGWARYRLGHVKRWITYARPDTGLDAAPGLAPTRVAAVPRHLWP